MYLAQIGLLAAIYPATWGIVQLVTGALSDRVGRKWLIVGGMWTAGVGIGVVTVAGAFAGFAVGAVLLGHRDRDGLSDAARGDRRCGASHMACVGRRRVSLVAGSRLRRRRVAGRFRGRCVWLRAPSGCRGTHIRSGLVSAIRLTETLRRHTEGEDNGHMNPNKALWEKGDFTRIAASMRESGEALVVELGITKGLKVLDLGCGDGTTAIPAARLGADVLGVDIASTLVEAGNKRAQRKA